MDNLLRNEFVDYYYDKHRHAFEMLITVPEIEVFTKTFQVRRCCRFIKKAPDPDPVTAPSAFSRAEKLSDEGSKLSHPEIEKYGFELYRFLDSQSYTFNPMPPSWAKR